METLRTVQRYAEALIADARRVLTRCVSGHLDTNAVAEDLHAIDRSAASIRVEIGALEGDSSRVRWPGAFGPAGPPELAALTRPGALGPYTFPLQ